jgi:hypothetical protein
MEKEITHSFHLCPILVVVVVVVVVEIIECLIESAKRNYIPIPKSSHLNYNYYYY